MSAASDLGGVQGLGPVVAEAAEPAFHADWERHVFGLVLAMGATGTWNLDAGRFAREDRPSAQYLAMSYYEIWLAGLERLLLEHGLVNGEELESGQSDGPGRQLTRRLAADAVAPALRHGSSTERAPATVARFGLGDAVRTRILDTKTHTRLPAYAQGKRGRITAVHGCHVFPDANAQFLGEQPQWLYTVTFTAEDLFDSPREPALTVSIDAFEPYLEPA